MLVASRMPDAARRNGALPPGQLPRLLPAKFAAGPVRLAGHLARYGPVPRARRDGRDVAALIDEVDRSGLAGRGGSAFPTARKLAAVAGQRGAIVVANGTEGEPASSKDKVLLARSPHLVLDGAVIAAEMVSAAEALIVVPRSIREIVDDAARERTRAGIDRVRIKVITAAGGFVSGEASAVVQWIDRGIPLPTAKPPRLSERGLRGKPTLVQNVETLAHLALIARYGSPWFCSVGTRQEPGSMLVTVLGAVQEPCVCEIAVGTPVGEILARAGGPSAPMRALLIGGYFGTWIDAATAMTIPFSAAGLADRGAAPGAGLIAALPADACGLRETARVARYLAGESAGQCGPCIFGLAAIAGELEKLADGRTSDTGTLWRWLGQVDGRGACSHPDGAVRLIRSALTTFEAEIAEHARGWCCGTASILPVPVRQDR